MDLDLFDAHELGSLGVVASRAPRLVRLRRGQYVTKDDLEAAEKEARYLARVRAVGAMRRGPIFAFESALALHGIAYGLEPAYVFTTGDPSASGGRGDVRSSHLPIPKRFVTDVRGLLCSDVAWTLADVARRRVPSEAVPSIDDALRRGLTTKEAVRDALSHQSKRGRVRARWSIAFATAASESFGESKSRVLIVLLGYPQPDLQHRVATSMGDRFVDFRWRIGDRDVFGEFDGLSKYGELAARDGKEGRQALVDEKIREDLLRRDGDLVRWIWSDLIRVERLDMILGGAGLPKRDPLLPPGVRLLR